MPKQPEAELLPSGRYRARLWNRITKSRETLPCPYTPEGTWPDRESCQLAIDRRLAEIDGHYVAAGIQPPTRRKAVTYRVFATSWARSCPGIEESSRGTLVSQVRSLCRWFGDLQVDEINKRLVNEWHHDIATKRWRGGKIIEVDGYKVWQGGKLVPADGGYSHNTRINWISALRSSLEAAVEEGLRSDNPAKALHSKAVQTSKRRIITETELGEVLARASWWFKAAILLAHDCGLRRAEICGLRWFRFTNLDIPSAAMVYVMDVATDKGTIRPYPKGKEGWEVPLTERTRLAMLELREHYPTATEMDRCFRVKGKYDFRPGTINYYWRLLRDAVGLTNPPIKFHMLRHACGTKLAEADAPATIIQAVLRHGNIATSQNYIERRKPDAARKWMHGAGQGGLAQVKPLPGGVSRDQGLDESGESVA